MKSADLRMIGDTLIRIVTPDMTPKQLVKAARKEHPKASKKDIVRAAFHAIISNSNSEPEKSRRLQAFAIKERGSSAAQHTL